MQKASLLVAWGILAVVSVSAALPLQDRGATTYDPNTGLEWLDLSFTAGRSYQEVLNGWGGFTTAQGFRFATRSEVINLFAAFGGNQYVSQANLEAANKALLYLGTTYPMPNLNRSWMIYDPSSEPTLSPQHVPAAVFGIDEPGGGIAGLQGFFNVPGLSPAREYHSFEIASGLVRVVPEPTFVAQCAAGLCIFVFASRRKRSGRL